MSISECSPTSGDISKTPFGYIVNRWKIDIMYWLAEFTIMRHRPPPPTGYGDHSHHAIQRIIPDHMAVLKGHEHEMRNA